MSEETKKPGCWNCVFRERKDKLDEDTSEDIRCIFHPTTMLPLPKFNVVTGKPEIQWVRVYSTNPPDFICGQHQDFHARTMLAPKDWPEIENLKPGDIVRGKLP